MTIVVTFVGPGGRKKTKQAVIDRVDDPSFRVDDDERAQGHVYGTPMPPRKPVHPEFSSGPCKKRPG